MPYVFTDAVDAIYATGTPGVTGFLSYDAYGVWRDRALEIDNGTATFGGQWEPLLTKDYQDGLLDYNKGYLPLYNLFVLGQVPGPGPGPGGTLGTLGLIAILAVVLMSRK